MPLNVMDAHYRSFAKLVLPELVKQEIGVLGMKPMANGLILKSKTVTAIECLHYALNLPTSVVITGCDSMEILEQALEAARTFRPMGKAEVQALLAKTAKAAATRRVRAVQDDLDLRRHRGQPGMAGRGVRAGAGGDAGVIADGSRTADRHAGRARLRRRRPDRGCWPLTAAARRSWWWTLQRACERRLAGRSSERATDARSEGAIP